MTVRCIHHADNCEKPQWTMRAGDRAKKWNWIKWRRRLNSIIYLCSRRHRDARSRRTQSNTCAKAKWNVCQPLKRKREIIDGTKCIIKLYHFFAVRRFFIYIAKFHSHIHRRAGSCAGRRARMVMHWKFSFRRFTKKKSPIVWLPRQSLFHPRTR